MADPGGGGGGAVGPPPSKVFVLILLYAICHITMEACEKHVDRPLSCIFKVYGYTMIFHRCSAVITSNIFVNGK